MSDAGDIVSNQKVSKQMSRMWPTKILYPALFLWHIVLQAVVTSFSSFSWGDELLCHNDSLSIRANWRASLRRIRCWLPEVLMIQRDHDEREDIQIEGSWSRQNAHRKPQIGYPWGYLYFRPHYLLTPVPLWSKTLVDRHGFRLHS